MLDAPLCSNNSYKVNNMIETRYYKFTRSKKHATSGRMHDCRQIQRSNSTVCKYVQLSVWYVESSNELTTNKSKNYQDEILSVPTLIPI